MLGYPDRTMYIVECGHGRSGRRLPCSYRSAPLAKEGMMKRGPALLFFVGLVLQCTSASKPTELGEHTEFPHVAVDVPELASGAIAVSDTKTKMGVRFSLVEASDSPRIRDGARVRYRGALAPDADLFLDLNRE